MSGGCVRINTGAAVPPGADAVVQVEDTRLEKEEELTGEELEISILTTPTPGQDIRYTQIVGCMRSTKDIGDVTASDASGPCPSFTALAEFQFNLDLKVF